MIHNEMSFLFNPTIQPSVGNVIRANNRGNTGDIFGTIPTNKIRIFKDPESGKSGRNVINYVNDTIYARDRLEQDPYVTLLNYFNDSGNSKTGPISMFLKPADFVYLKDLGVYPINRLIILRRYRDGCIVPNNLTLFKEKPIATAIGWIKMDDANKDLFEFSFSEKWIEQTDTLDKVIQKIMKEQFGIKTETFLPIPAWSQGFLFGMLNKMGLTNYDSKNVPTGDPNVLRVGLMRDIETQSLASELKITFETSYEQKYIDGVDPGTSFQDILSNIARIGTSDQKFIIKSTSESFKKFVEAVNSNAAGSVDKWVAFGKEMIAAFVGAISSLFEAGGAVDQYSKELQKQTDLQTQQGIKNLTQPASGTANVIVYESKEDKVGKKINVESISTGVFKGGGVYYSGNPLIKMSQQPAESEIKKNIGGINETVNTASLTGTATKLLVSGIKTLLAGSVYRYRWPLRGSIGLMSGLSTTPWHLTVGNPFSPILNMANIYVSDVDLKFSNELGFQDMPKRVDVTIQLKMGRPFGTGEIERMFNNQYGRIYSKPTDEKTATDSGDSEKGKDKQTPTNQAPPETKTEDKKTTMDRSLDQLKNGQKVDKTYTQTTQKVINTNGATVDPNAINFFNK